MQSKDQSTPPTTRVAIVTGAAQGIGQSIVLQLADDGIDVAINDIASKAGAIDEVVKEVQAKGRRAIAIPGDVSDEAEVQAMIQKTVDELGGLDIMVANAGIVHMSPFVDTSMETFNRVMAVNVTGTMLCLKYGAIQMIKQGRGGRLLVASSLAGLSAGRGACAYSATKFAVRGIMQTAALELRQHNITANAYAPGIIKTPMVNPPGTEWGDGMPLKQAAGLPLDTPVAEPEVVASIVSYLCKPEAYFITGQTISVNGGALLQ